MSIVIGIILIVVGFFVTFKSEAILSTFGRIEFFEDKMATAGGSRLGYKLIGILMFFFGVLTLTGLIGGFMGFVLSPLLKYNQQ